MVESDRLAHEAKTKQEHQEQGGTRKEQEREAFTVAEKPRTANRQGAKNEFKRGRGGGRGFWCRKALFLLEDRRARCNNHKNIPSIEDVEENVVSHYAPQAADHDDRCLFVHGSHQR